MQEQYLDLGNKDVNNGQYLLAVFKIVPYGDEGLDSAATEVAAESSTGSNIKVGTMTSFSDSLDAKVYKIEKENNLVWIAYPWRIFDRGGNVQNIITFIAGNIYGMGNLKECKLLDVYFPPQMLVQYDGPSTTLDELRDYLEIYHRPVLGCIVKPKIGLTSSEYAELCYDFWKGGGDFVKNDEPQADQEFAPYDRMVKDVSDAMKRAEDETGIKKVHSFNVSAADFDTMLGRADLIASVMQPGSYAYLVDGITAGWTAVQTIQRRYPHTFLHFHRAGHGAYTRKESPFGYSVPVLTKMARLAGASGLHTGTAGVGKMSGSPEEDVVAAQLALRLSAKGPYFEQVWAEIPKTDTDLKETIEEEELIWKNSPRELAKKRAKDGSKGRDEYKWRGTKKTAPITSGGLNPTKVAKMIETIGTIDFIMTMGGGVHSHPSGTTAGAKAVVQAFDAWYEDVDIEKYARDHKELMEAVEFFGSK